MRNYIFAWLIPLLALAGLGLCSQRAFYWDYFPVKDILTLPAQPISQVQVVNVWATWCKPCVQELPQLHQLVTPYKSQEVELYAYAASDNSKAQAFIAQHPEWQRIHWVYSRDYRQEKLLVAGFVDVGESAIPITYIVQKNRIIRHFVGYSPENMGAIKQTLDSLLQKES